MRYAILFILLLWSGTVYGKNYPMLHFTIEDGLPSNTIYNIYEAPDGYIWIGTDKGVSRYNGSRFENFTTADGLADNECFFFQPDHEGRLWLASFNGELCYYKEGKFHNARNTPFLRKPFKAAAIQSIFINKDSSILILSDRREEVLLIEKEKVSVLDFTYLRDPDIESRQLHYIERLQKNRFQLYFSKVRILLEDHRIVARDTLEKTISLMSFDLNHRWYITDQHQILDAAFRDISFPFDSKLKDNRIYLVRQYEHHRYLCTSNGLWTDSFGVLLPNQVVHTLSQDAQHNLWIGTSKNGLYLMHHQFTTSKSINNAYQSNIVYAHTQKGLLYYFSKEGKLFRTTNKDSLECLVSLDNYRRFYRNFYAVENGIKQYNNYSDSYLYTLFRLCYQFKANENSYKIIADATQLNQDRIYNGIKSFLKTDSYEYLKGRILINVIKVNETSNQIYPTCVNDKKDAMFGFALASDNTVWTSTVSAVYKIKDTTAQIQKQFGSLAFRELIFLQKNLVGITHDNDLVLCRDYESQQVKSNSLRVQEDCVWNKFYPINDSTVLISTNNYPRVLTLYPSRSPLRYRIRVLEDPFIPYQAEYVYIDSNRAHFFKEGKLHSFPKDYLTQQVPLPKVRFKSITTAKGSLYIKDTLCIDYEASNNLKIIFTAISLYHKNLSFEYSIGSSSQAAKWIAFKGEELNLVRLGFGSFKVSIRAKTISGEYSTPSSFILIVRNPFWATWWFMAICIVIGIAVVAFFARIGIKRRLRKKELELRFVQSEYKTLNALMNPHFIFNSLNSVQSLVNNHENKSASRYIRVFSDLIRQNMHNIAQDLIPLSKELDLIENYLKIEQLRFKEALNYTIHMADSIEADLIMVPPLLIQPLVENAVKHGIWPKQNKDGQISIEVYESEDKLFIEIRDNGVGLNTNKKSDTLHESYAMSNIHKRIEQLSQIHQTSISVSITEMKDEDQQVIGTMAVICMEN